MFNRSIKYVLLLMLNIAVLFTLYFNKGPKETGVFDTQFVIGLLKERDELQSALIDAEMAAMQYDKQADKQSIIAAGNETQSSQELLTQIDTLKAEISKLKADIENPIYLKTVYISGQKCNKPQFDELVCIQELLVRPQFSKVPTSEVKVTVYAPNKQVLASASFTSSRSQLFRFPLGRGREVLAGEFTASFEVDDQYLTTEGHIIRH